MMLLSSGKLVCPTRNNERGSSVMLLAEIYVISFNIFVIHPARGFGTTTLQG